MGRSGLQNGKKDNPEQTRQTSSQSPAFTVLPEKDNADSGPGAESEALDGSDQVELLLTGLLNSLRHNEVAIIGGLLHSLRHDGTPEEIATHIRQNFKSLQDQGIMSAESLDEGKLVAMASQAATPLASSVKPTEGHRCDLPHTRPPTHATSQSRQGSLTSSASQLDEFMSCPHCQGSSK